MAKVELYADGTLLGTDTSAPYTVSWNSASVQDGVYTLAAMAYDHAGNVRTSSRGRGERRTTPCRTRRSRHPCTGTWSGGTVSLEATASDTGGVTKVEFYADATLLGTDTSAPYALSWSTVRAWGRGPIRSR